MIILYNIICCKR